MSRFARFHLPFACIGLLLLSGHYHGSALASGPALPSAYAADKVQLLVTFKQTSGFVPQRAGSGFRTYAGNQYEITPQIRYLIDEIAHKYRLREIAGWRIRTLTVYCVVYELLYPAELQTTLAALNTDPLVETAQPMNRFTTQTVTEDRQYNDPYLKLQHAWLAMGLSDIHHDVTGKNITVAIIDTALDSTHPDLRHGVVKTESHIPASLTNATEKKRVHATAIAGVIAAQAGNRVGIAGVAPDSRIVSLEACWYETALSEFAVCNSFSLARALSSAIDQRVDIVNLSLAGPEDPLLSRLIEQAISRNVVVIAAVGEQSIRNFPASLDGVIAVMSDAQLATPSKHHYLVRAPGQDIISTAANADYDFFSGNSIAAAQVSGVLALIMQKYSSRKIEALLQGLNANATADICQLLQPLSHETDANLCTRLLHTALQEGNQ